MYVEVRPMNHQGKPLVKAVAAKQPASRGQLRIFENRLHNFGRVVRCATLTSSTDGMDSHQLPELLDAEVIYLDSSLMRLRGLEQVGGTLFGQTWDVRVV